MSLLITRPNHDLTTNYLYFWSEKIIEQAEKSKVKTVDLKGKRVNKTELTSIIHKLQPSLVVFNGHGDHKTVAGFNNEILIQAGKNEDLLKKKIIYAISCSSARTLGPRCIRIDTKAYIGYTDDFIFMFDESKIV